jgi:hypothetical protein
MAKRFTDSEKFSDPWYRRLSLLHKVIWEYLLAECNHAGVVEKFDIELMSFKIGADVSMEDLLSFGDRIVFVSDSVLFIPNFIIFQYEKLNPQNKVHASVLRELEKWSLPTPTKTLPSPLEGSKDKIKDKDKDKDKEKEKESTNIVQLSSTKLDTLDFVSSKQCKEMFEIYQEECKELAPLSFERRNKRIIDKMAVYLNETDNDIGVFRDVCKKANKLKTIANRLIDFETVINCYVGILNGKYIDKEQEQNSIEALRARLLGKGNE